MRILFQGDSITDCGRDREDKHSLAGYTALVADILGKEHEYFNRGISGDTSKMVLDRYEKDIKALTPDIMTLLIGINDVWRFHDSNLYTSPKMYYENVEKILVETKKDFPNVKIIMIEPFLLPSPDRLPWRRECIEFIDACRDLAVKYADGFIPIDGLFAKECLTTPWQELSYDGVHPAKKGNELIAKYLSDEIKRFL